MRSFYRFFQTLWQFNAEDDEWKKLGGKVEPLEEDGIHIFSAALTTTGVFSIFDENPAPTYYEYTQPELVEKVEASPFPTVFPPEENEEEIQNPEDMSVEQESIVPALTPTENNNPIPPISPREPEVNQIDDSTSQPSLATLPENTDYFNENLPEKLPEAGIEETKKSFPIVMILALFILSTSIYFGFSKKY